MKRILGTVVMALLAALTLPSAALAVDMEFYTYGGFEAVVSAFTQLTLIFGNSAYQSLYYTVVVAGIGFGAAVAYIRLVSGSSGSILGWAPIAAVGIAIYIGLFVPKGNLAIYDPVYNKFQIVPNVPDGVVIVAGTMNAIERGLVEIISNSTDPDSYQSQAGGKGYLGLYMLTTTPITANNAFLDTSVDRYMEDCVAFALDNPASTLTIDELRKTTTSFSASIAKASNAAIPTVYYNAANPTGVVTTCNVAWNNLVIDLTQAALQNNITATCSSMGYDTSDAPQLTQCQTMLYNIQSVGGLGAASLDALVRQVYLYNRLDQVFRTSNSAAASNHQFLLNASGTMKAANEWIPILRAVLTAIVVALIPFLTIFLPTPICGRSMGLMFGLFVWLTTWGICDAITHKFAISYATKLWLQVRQNALGMDALYFFPSQTVKILAMFGTLRMGGLMLATGLTGVLVKFGGSVMGMLAGNMMGQIQSAGISGGAKTEDIAGRAGAISSNATSMPTLTWANHHSLAARGGEALARLDSGTSSFETMSGAFGGTRGVSEMMANANTGLMTSRGGAGAGMREYGLPGAANASQFNAESGLHQTGITAAAFDFNSREHGATAAAPMTSVANVASHLTANGIPTSPSDLSNAMHNFQTAMGYGRATTVEGMTGTSGFIEAGRAAGTGQGFSDVEKLKHADQVRAAANHAMPDEWKKNPALYDINQKSATPLGVATFIGAMQGVGIRYATEHGVATVDQRSDGVLSRSAEVGTMPAGDRQDANKFAQQLDKAGLHHEATAVRSLAKSGGAFGYGASYDSHGHVAGASAERGGVVTDLDRSNKEKGWTVTNVGRQTNDFRNVNLSGSETLGGNRVTVDNTTTRRDGSITEHLDRETFDSFSGELGGVTLAGGTFERRGGTFQAEGPLRSGGYGSASGVASGRGRHRSYRTQSFNDRQGNQYGEGSAFRQLVTYGSVPESAVMNDQSKQQWASSFVNQMHLIRKEGYNLSKYSSFGFTGGVGASRSTGGGEGGGGSGGSGGGITAGMRATVDRRTNVTEDINLQLREVMKIMDKHPNTLQGRKEMGTELINYYDNNLGKTGTREVGMGGPYKRSK